MVTHTVRGGASHRVACARERFSQSQWTGATSLLPAERIEEGMRAEGITPYRCLYTPLYQKLASELTVREVRVAVKGFWVKMLVAVTTLLGFRRGAKYICTIPLYVLIPFSEIRLDYWDVFGRPPGVRYHYHVQPALPTHNYF